MSGAENGKTVKVHYTGKLDNGEIFDTSAEREPLEFTLGEGSLIPGFENAIIGMTPGESKTVKIPSEEAYGPHIGDMVRKVEKTQLPSDFKPEVGQRLQIPQKDGMVLFVKVTEITESDVTLDGNHPLAGEDLTFDLDLIEIG